MLVAEHGHDYRDDLGGGGWHGAMNYAGFLRPVWSWLRGDDLPDELEHSFWGVPVGLRRIGGAEAVASMRAFRAGMPWPSVLHSWPLLDSHDTPRFRTVAGSRERHVVGIGLQMTTPGVPMVFAGDELGLEGDWGEDARRTMPWDRPESWDTALFEEYRRLIALRRSSDALARGGIRYAAVGERRDRLPAREPRRAPPVPREPSLARAGLTAARRARLLLARAAVRRGGCLRGRPCDAAVRRSGVPRLEAHVNIEEGVARRG